MKHNPAVDLSEMEHALAAEQADAYDQATQSMPWAQPDQSRQRDLDEIEFAALQQLLAKRAGMVG